MKTNTTNGKNYMKKIMIIALCAVMGVCSVFAQTAIDVYDFKASVKVPVLNGGTRTYASRTFKGYMYFEYDSATNPVSSCYIVAQNTKSKVTHTIDLTDGFYSLMGKSTKKVARPTPTVWFVGEDDAAEYDTNTVETHEFIKFISLAATGSTKTTKTKTTSCTMCGDAVTMTEYCNKLTSLSGNLNGVMLCECPPEEPGWWHTVIAWFCGQAEGTNEEIRVSEAAFYGTWTAKYNSKLSTVTND